MAFEIAVTTSATLCPVFALVSRNSILFSLEYALAVLFSLNGVLEILLETLGRRRLAAVCSASDGCRSGIDSREVCHVPLLKWSLCVARLSAWPIGKERELYILLQLSAGFLKVLIPSTL
jgi:hypothetical protein